MTRYKKTQMNAICVLIVVLKLDVNSFYCDLKKRTVDCENAIRCSFFDFLIGGFNGFTHVGLQLI